MNDKKADLTREELEAQLAKSNAALAASQAIIAAAKDGKPVKVPVAGSFNAEWTTPKGKQKKKVEFQDGAINVRLKDGSVVSSEALLKLANGKTLSEEEKEASPALVNFDKDAAVEWLTHLAKVGYGYLK